MTNRLAAARQRVKKAELLAALRETKLVSLAARRVGIERPRVYAWCAKDPQFREDLRAVQDSILDELEAQLIALGTGKLKRPVVSAGKVVAYEDIYDVRALELILKAYRPKFRERAALEVSGTVEQHVEIKKEISVTFVADVTRILAEQGLVGNNPPEQLPEHEPDDALGSAKARHPLRLLEDGS